jgi:SAM-dependent methyltransferase
MVSPVGTLHKKLVFGRRTRILVDWLSDMLPADARTLDVGCGDGTIDFLIQQKRPDIAIEGIDVLVRSGTRIPVTKFDGYAIPFQDKSFDAVMFTDVLHHTNDPMVLLREARRVARKAVIIKDHTMNGPFAYETLRLMDWVGNAHHGVALPYNYWPQEKWQEALTAIGLRTERWQSRVGLYPWPFSHVFDRGLHFVARFSPV